MDNPEHGYNDDMNFIPIVEDKSEGIYIVLGCVHVPFENKVLTKPLFEFIDSMSADIAGVVIAGDFLDMNSLSAYDRGMLPIEGINLGIEYQRGNEFLDIIDQCLGHEVYKAYIYGNHEHRYFKWKRSVDNSKLGAAVQSPHGALHLENRGYNIYTNWTEDAVDIGKLKIIHGVYHNMHATKKHMTSFMQDVLFAHTHRFGIYSENGVAGYNMGWLGDKNQVAFSYASGPMKRSWVNGFAVCTLYNNNTSVELIRCQEDGFVFGGKRYAHNSNYLKV